MSEELTPQATGDATVPEKPTKTKGKLPVIVMLALLLGMGGFFGVKMRQPKTVEKPEVKLGAVMKLDEFLVNLSDGTTYLRTEISLHLKEGAKIEAGGGEGEGGGGGAELPAMRDAIIGVLTSRKPTEVRSLDGKRALRVAIAEAVNEVLEKLEAAHGEKPAATDAGAKKVEKKTEQPGESKGQPAGESKTSAAKKEEAPKHPDWDSQTGPVLKVYFTSFAMQQG